MTHADKASQAHDVKNEDFAYIHPLPEGQALIVGDFASSNFKGLDKLAEAELGNILSELVAKDSSVPPPVLLAQVATQFNNRLLNYKQSYDSSFQCCAVLSVVLGRTLYFLPIGDCRIALVRDGAYWNMNGSLWRDPSGNNLPVVIRSDTKVKRAAEDPPQQFLGYSQVALSPSDVRSLPLEEHDVLLLYSDGIDKVISPVDFLTLLAGDLDGSKPGELVSKVMSEVAQRPHDDDCTLIVATGPHEFTRRELEERQREKDLHTRLTSLETWVNSVGELNQSISEVRAFVNDIGPSLQEVLKNAPGGKQRTPSRLEGLEDRLKELNETYIKNAVNEAQRVVTEGLLTAVEGRVKQAYQEAMQEAGGNAQVQETGPAHKGIEAEVSNAVTRVLEGFRISLAQDIKVLLTPKEGDGSSNQSSADGDKKGESVSNEPPPPSPDSGKPPAVAPAETPPAETEPVVPSYLDKLTLRSRYREGVLYVRTNAEGVKFRLLDEGDLEPSELKAATDGFAILAFVSRDSAPAGWLTAFYCRLLTDTQKNPPRYDIAELEQWVFTQANIFAHESRVLDEAELDSYTRLRDRYRKLRTNSSGWRALFSGGIGGNELELAKSFVADPRSPDGQVDGGEHRPEGQPPLGNGGRAKLHFLTFRPVIYVSLFLIAILLVSYFGGRVVQSLISDGTRADKAAKATPTTAAGSVSQKMRFAFGADGQTLYLIPAELPPLDYRARLGQGHNFKNKFGDTEFESKESALSRIAAEGGNMIESPGRESSDSLTDDLAVYPVTQGDIQPTANTPDSQCVNFLKRVNNQIEGAGNHTHLDQLYALNPGLNCGKLREGMNLVVYKESPPH